MSTSTSLCRLSSSSTVWRLSDILRDHARQSSWRGGVEAAQTLERAKQILLTELPSCEGRLRPLHVRSGVLTIVAEHPAYAQEIRMKESTILEYVNQPKQAVRRIAVRVGPIIPEP